MTSYKGSLRIAATHDVIESEFVVDEDRLEVVAGGERLGSWPLSELWFENTGSQVQMELDGESVVLIVSNHDAFVEALAPPKRRRKKRKKRKTPRQETRGPETPRPETRGPETRGPETRGPETPRQETPRQETPRQETPRQETPRQETPRQKTPRQKTPRRPKRAKRERTRSRLDMLDTIRHLTSRETWRGWLSQRVVKWSVASFAVIVVALLALFATNSLGMILVLLGMVALVVAALAVSEDLTAYAWIPGELSESALIIAGTTAMAIGGVLILIS